MHGRPLLLFMFALVYGSSLLDSTCVMCFVSPLLARVPRSCYPSRMNSQLLSRFFQIRYSSNGSTSQLLSGGVTNVQSTATENGIAGLHPSVRRNSAALLTAVLSDDVALAPAVAGVSASLQSQMLISATNGSGASAPADGAKLGSTDPSAESRRRLTQLAVVADIDAQTRSKVLQGPGASCSFYLRLSCAF